MRRHRKWVLVGFTFTGLMHAGPHRIRLHGDTILREGTEATYQVTVQNTLDKDYEDMVIAIEGLNARGLQFLSADSATLEIFSHTVDGTTQLEAFGKFLASSDVATVTFTVKACSLENIGDLATQQITIRVTGGNFRRGVVRKSITVYKSE